jgi:hypothetical protein
MKEKVDTTEGKRNMGKENYYKKQKMKVKLD